MPRVASKDQAEEKEEALKNKLLNQAKAEGEALKALGPSGLALTNYAIVFSDGAVLRMPAQSCYANYKYTVGPYLSNLKKDVHPIYQVDYVDERYGPYRKQAAELTPKEIEMHEAWIKFCVLDSPYAHCYVSKQWKKYREGIFVTNLQFTPQEITVAGQLMRLRCEHRHMIRRWYAMQKKINPTLAMVLAGLTSDVSEKGQVFRFGYCPHQPFDNFLTKRALGNMLAGKLDRSKLKTMRDRCANYTGQMTIWDSRVDPYDDGRLEQPKKHGEETVSETSWGGKVFSYTFQMRDIVEVAKEFLRINKLKEGYADKA